MCSDDLFTASHSAHPAVHYSYSLSLAPYFTRSCYLLPVQACMLGKGKSIAVCKTSPHRYGKSLTIWDHTVLPANRQR